ncbi:4'-phosphopantetheinyl transferase superfamily protein [Sphingobium sp.]|uniref:holo-ACP synthase n=1 Tax=Sphingobium sp. TaxID=1912891 RepID=UPI001A254B5E|nr:4'-phosphopantetheinyl transferase superfamily protein [Sphingobium sp.]MBJ7376366.1 4'-phosphopantetheinyl transferase superfamily protein [Sphingobium sp.]
MTIIAVGLDLVELDRFSILYGDLDPDVLDRCFTAREQAMEGTAGERLARLAARFAVKEAVLKTIGGLQDGIALTDIEVISDGVTPPTVRVTGGAWAAATANGVSGWLISLTHGAHSAAAVALATGSTGT